MKKIFVFAVLMLLCANAALAAWSEFEDTEINIRAGVDLPGRFDIEVEDMAKKFDTEIGASASIELLAPTAYEKFKIGFGVEYLYYRIYEMKSKILDYDFVNDVWIIAGEETLKPQISFLPVYLTLQVNPFGSAKGLFVKGNIGYIAYAEAYDKSGHHTFSGNLYWAFASGYEFASGFLFDVSYSAYYGEYDSDAALSPKFTYYKFGFNVGYKFKL